MSLFGPDTRLPGLVPEGIARHAVLVEPAELPADPHPAADAPARPLVRPRRRREPRRRPRRRLHLPVLSPAGARTARLGDGGIGASPAPAFSPRACSPATSRCWRPTPHCRCSSGSPSGAPPRTRRAALRLNLVALAAAAGCVMVAGHPQVPVYAVAATLVYLAARLPVRRSAVAGGGAGRGRGVRGVRAVPHAPTHRPQHARLLSLERAANDVPFPAWRLKAFVLPWADGWPSNVVAAGQHLPFTRGEEPLFWETVCYVGWMPLAAAAFVAARRIAFRQRPDRRWLVVAVLIGAGGAGLRTAPRPALLPGGPWTILRSPARQAYLTTFALSLWPRAGRSRALATIRRPAFGPRARGRRRGDRRRACRATRSTSAATRPRSAGSSRTPRSSPRTPIIPRGPGSRSTSTSCTR